MEALGHRPLGVGRGRADIVIFKRWEHKYGDLPEKLGLYRPAFQCNSKSSKVIRIDQITSY